MIKLRTLCLENFDSTNLEHYDLAKNLHSDMDVVTYISMNFLNFIERTTSHTDSDDYEVLTSYVIKNENDIPVGMMGSLSEEKDNVVDLWYAIKPNYRKCGYGRKILSQITQYLIEEKYDDIMLMIDSKNIASNNLAISQGYNKVTEKCNGKDKINVYQYFKK